MFIQAEPRAPVGGGHPHDRLAVVLKLATCFASPMFVSVTEDELRELAILHEEIADQVEQHDDMEGAGRRRARAAELRALVGEVGA